MAHSMGNRALVGALRELQNHVDRPLIGREDLPKISQVVFAAADVKMADFIGLVQGFLSDSQDADIPTLTVYCSRDDFPLRVSHKCKKYLHYSMSRERTDYARLGDTQTCEDSSDELSVHFVDVVDATGVGPSTLQHSYHCEVPAVLDDLKDILQGGPRAADRQRLQKHRLSSDPTDRFIMHVFNTEEYCKARLVHYLRTICTLLFGADYNYL
jgi:esterase/lipase superfamily enzyme